MIPLNPPTPPTPWPDRRVLVTGGAGFLGSAVVRALERRGVPRERVLVARRAEFDLTTREGARRAVTATIGGAPADVVIHCAGIVGGIQANRDRPAEMFFGNAAMAMNLIEESRLASVNGAGTNGGVFVQIGSMTSYPADAPIPFREDSLWRGYPDAASAPYGVAKLAAWQMLDACARQHGFRSAYLIPVNLYGPGDNVQDVRNAHVAGSLVKRICDAQAESAPEVVCWGTGSPTREFLYVDDAAEAVLRAAERVRDPAPINIGNGPAGEITIRALAELIARLAGYRGSLVWDASKPDGQPRRCLDVSRAAELLGWRARTPLEEGLRRTIEWYRDTRAGR